MAPEVSIVVPTRNRAPHLARLLESLERQRDVDVEVIVVDDASEDETESVLAAADDRTGLRTLRRDRGGEGAAAVRNAGWQVASAPLVAFIDDDCVASEGWAAALLAAHERHPGALVQGRTQAAPEGPAMHSAFSRSIIVEQLGPWYETCNIAYPKALLDELGGFDDSLTATEDTDLALRARKAGAGAVFAPDALVHHAIHVPGAVGLMRDAPRWRGFGRTVKRHPELREALVHRYFWKPGHERLLLALLGAALAPRTRGVSLALAIPYVRGYRPVHDSLPGTIASLPAHALVDAAEIAALLRGSIDARTLIV